MSAKRTADIHIIPAKITLDDSVLDSALKRFAMPFVMGLHTSRANDDGEMVHIFEIAGVANDILVWEVLQWQLIGLVNLTDMQSQGVAADGLTVYTVYGIECQTEQSV